MNSSRYRAIVAELCQIVGIKETEQLFSGGHLLIDEYAVWLVHDEPTDNDHLCVYIDLGELPEEGREEIYRELLEINIEMRAGLQGVMGIHPKTEHILYAFRFELKDGAGGRDLLQRIVDFIDDIQDGMPMPAQPGQQAAQALASPAGTMR